MAEVLQLEFAFWSKKLCQIQRGQVAGRVVQKHVLRARIRRIDATILLTSMPLVDRRVVLRARIGANPCGPGDTVPEVPCLDGLGNFAVDSALELPIAVRFKRRKKIVGDPDAVV